MKRNEMYKPTNDDWYPNYPDNLVRLCYVGELSDGTFRVAVWGADDCGYEADYKLEGDAISIFYRLSRYPKIDKADVEHLGFNHA